MYLVVATPIEAFHKSESLGFSMNERKTPVVDLLLYTHMLDALPHEYTYEVRMLQGQETSRGMTSS